MRKLFAALALALAATGCAYVNSAQPGSSAVTGEGWYTKVTMFLGIPIDQNVYYCPRDTPTKCTRAQWR